MLKLSPCELQALCDAAWLADTKTGHVFAFFLQRAGKYDGMNFLCDDCLKGLMNLQVEQKARALQRAVQSSRADGASGVGKDQPPPPSPPDGEESPTWIDGRDL